MSKMPIADRFWGHVRRGPPGACWLWVASLDGKGYGQFHRNGKNVRAHRVAYELAHGPIPQGSCILHRCDNPACVNPRHLFIGSMRDNTTDMLRKRRDGHGRLPGQTNPNAKLTDDDVRAIRSRRNEGQTLGEIAADYGITEANVSIIAKGKGWKHVK